MNRWAKGQVASGIFHILTSGMALYLAKASLMKVVYGRGDMRWQETHARAHIPHRHGVSWVGCFSMNDSYSYCMLKMVVFCGWRFYKSLMLTRVMKKAATQSVDHRSVFKMVAGDLASATAISCGDDELKVISEDLRSKYISRVFSFF